mgnify:FL=1
MEASVKLISKFKPLYQNKTRYFILTGGRASSKSFHVTDFLLKLSYEQGHSILFTRYTMISAGVSVIPEFIDKIDRYDVNNVFGVNQSDITNLLTGSKIIFKGIKTGSGNQTANLKSLQGITTLVIEEAEELVDEDIFDKIDESVRVRDVDNRVIMILNPSTKEHWIYKKFFEQAGVEPGFNGVKGDTTYIHTTYLDNAENISESIIKKFERLKVTQPKRYEHRVMGGWLERAEGVVFDNWRLGDFDDTLPVIYGLDFGFYPDPTALVKVAIDSKRKRIYVKQMVYKQELTTDQLSLQLPKSKELIICDNSEPRLTSELITKGHNLRRVTKFNDSIKAGIDFMSQHEIIVDADSVDLVKEFNNYVWNDRKSSTPIDAWNHCFVYDTKILTGNGLVSIGDIGEGDFVITPNGKREVLKKFNNGTKQVRQYLMQFGMFSLSLESTKEHKVKTTKGWKEISKLKKGDRLYLHKSLMEEFITNTLMKDTFQREEIDYTGLFGNFIMGKFQKAIMSTMLMVIPKTTISKTLIWLMQTSTLDTRVKNATKRTLNGINHFMKKALRLLKNGIGHPKEESGTKNMGKSVGKEENTGNSIARFAERNMKQGMQESVNTAMLTVKLKHLELGEEKRRKVYDIMVDSEHCYFANGVLAHNCIDSIRYACMEYANLKNKTQAATYNRKSKLKKDLRKFL